MNRIWTNRAEERYYELILDLINKWSDDTAQKFIDQVEHTLKLIERNPNIAVASKSHPYLRKATINKHNYLTYQIDGEDLILLKFGTYIMSAGDTD
jgi:plasmid stabilization system protein ParE